MHQLQASALGSSLVDEYRMAKGTHNSSWDQDPQEYFEKLNEFFEKAEKNIPEMVDWNILIF